MAETIKDDQSTLLTKQNLPEKYEQKQPSSSKNRITDLPEDIMHNIISFLTDKDAVKFCAASRKWKSLTTSLPNLLFHARPLNCEEVDRFASFVDKTLMSRPSSLNIKKLLLNFPYRDRDRLEDKVDSWLQFAISHQVEELNLTLDKYRWPNCLVRNSSVRKLSLTSLLNYKYDDDIAGWCWTSLKVISLNKTWLDSDVIRCILRGSPLIECLTLRQCKIFSSDSNNYMIDTSCTSLKELVMDGCDIDGHWAQKDLEFFGPNLRSLTLVGCMNIHKLRLSDLTSLVEVHMGSLPFGFLAYHEHEIIGRIFQNLSHVKKFTVGARCVKVISYKKLTREWLPQPLTCKILKIEMSRLDKIYLPGIAALLRSSPFLEQLIIDGKLWDDEDGKFCDIQELSWSKEEYFKEQNRHWRSPINARVREYIMEENYWSWETETFMCLNQNLKSVEIIRFNARSYPEGSQILTKTVKFLLENAKVLEKLIVHVDGLEWEIRESLLQHPRASPNAVVVVKRLS